MDISTEHWAEDKATRLRCRPSCLGVWVASRISSLEREGFVQHLSPVEQDALTLLNHVNTISARIPSSQASKIFTRNEIRSYFACIYISISFNRFKSCFIQISQEPGTGAEAPLRFLSTSFVIAPMTDCWPQDLCDYGRVTVLLRDALRCTTSSIPFPHPKVLNRHCTD